METTDYEYHVYEDIPIKDEPIMESSEVCTNYWQTQAERPTVEGSHIKCGEIFIDPGQSYILICSLCTKQFNSLESFGDHINNEHLHELQPEYKPFAGLHFDQIPIASNEDSPQQDVLKLHDTKTEPELFSLPEDSAEVSEISSGGCKETGDLLTCTICATKYKHKSSYKRHLKNCHGIVESSMPNELHEHEESDSVQACMADEEESIPIEEESIELDVKPILPANSCTAESALDAETSEKYNSECEESNSGMFACAICGCKYKHKLWYNKHLKMRHGAQGDSNTEQPKAARFACTLCGRSYSRRCRLTRHVERDHGAEAAVNLFPKKVRCKYCGEINSNEQALAIHLESKHPGDKKYSCRYCEKTFKGRHERKRHMNLDHAAQEASKSDNSNAVRFSCTMCDRSFYRRYRLAIHVKMDHGPEAFVNMFPQKVRCKYCGEVVSSKEALATHIESSHPGDNKYSCSYCDRSFKTSNGLGSHINLHKGLAAQFKCPHCPKSFMNNTTLTAHVRSNHLGEKPHQCELCGKCFKKKGDFNRHMTLHKKFGNLKCDICDKDFYSAYLLVIHKRRHSLDRSYCCNICDKSFSGAKTLKAHQKLLHSEVESTEKCNE